MKCVYKSTLLSILFLSLVNIVHAQSPFIIELNSTGAIVIAKRFYVKDVIDGRNDKLNNGFALVNKRKTKIVFNGGPTSQFMHYLSTVLPPPDSNLLPVVISISKLVLTERPAAKGNIVKTEITIEFLREDNAELLQLNELSSWMEQSASKDASILQEKNIRQILDKMIIQFEDLIAEQKTNPLFAARIEFKVIHTVDEDEKDDTIYWSNAIKLTWNDFKGKPGTGEFAAQSNCAFAQNIQPIVENGIGTFYINARAAFFKHDSWVQNDQHTTDILEHEQLHFDIAEWHIRLLRKQIASKVLSISHYVAIINKLCSGVWREYSLTQKNYDTETAHGTIKEAQDRWIRKVEVEMNALKDY